MIRRMAMDNNVDHGELMRLIRLGESDEEQSSYHSAPSGSDSSKRKKTPSSTALIPTAKQPKPLGLFPPGDPGALISVLSNIGKFYMVRGAEVGSSAGAAAAEVKTGAKRALLRRKMNMAIERSFGPHMTQEDARQFGERMREVHRRQAVVDEQMRLVLGNLPEEQQLALREEQKLAIGRPLPDSDDDKVEKALDVMDDADRLATIAAQKEFEREAQMEKKRQEAAAKARQHLHSMDEDDDDADILAKINQVNRDVMAKGQRTPEQLAEMRNLERSGFGGMASSSSGYPTPSTNRPTAFKPASPAPTEPAYSSGDESTKSNIFYITKPLEDMYFAELVGTINAFNKLRPNNPIKLHKWTPTSTNRLYNMLVKALDEDGNIRLQLYHGKHPAPRV